MSDKTHVPDKLHGYTLQVRHMMYELISLNLEQIVSVEMFEDVAVENGETITAEQIKSDLSSNNPVADRSVVFWKTLYNWCQYIEQKLLSIDKTIFKFVVIANRQIYSGSIPKSFHDVNSIKDAELVLNEAIIKLWGHNNEKKNTIPDTYKDYLTYIFENKGNRRNILLHIIKAMKIEIYAETYAEKLYERFCSQVIPKEYQKELFIYMLGWVYEKVNSMTKNGNPAFIKSEEFRNTLLTQVSSYNINTILASVSIQPTQKIAQAEIERQDVYIKQLNLIELEDIKKIEAASDFLRTRTEKTLWAEKGLVTSKSFDEYEDSLKRIWSNQKIITNIQCRSTCNEAEQGQLLYCLCQNESRTTKVQNKDVPEFFGSGYLNDLANEPFESPYIGWHPKYIELLKGDDKNNE